MAPDCDRNRVSTAWEDLVNSFTSTFTKPMESLHDWVEAKQSIYSRCNTHEWYHQKFRRVPTIDECEDDDVVCFAEANMQFKRDRLVDSEIVAILRQRFENCIIYERPHHMEKCAKILEEYEEATTNWFIKYGELGGWGSVKDCYMKQKHRLIWEKKFGEVGSIDSSNSDAEN